eukprot:12016517-Alexandrium_andersonii.AAC.1
MWCCVEHDADVSWQFVASPVLIHHHPIPRRRVLHVGALPLRGTLIHLPSFDICSEEDMGARQRAMASEPPDIQPSGTSTGSARWIPFKPTPPSIHTQRVLEGLPQTFHQEYAAQLGLSAESTEVVVALKLPECPICIEYITFQNRYREVYGPNHAAVAIPVPWATWKSKRDANNYAGSILHSGRPSPPEFIPIVIAKQ